MAWTAPATYTTGEVVTAAKLNTHIRDNLRFLKGLDGVITLSNTLNVLQDPASTRYSMSMYVLGAGGVIQSYDFDTSSYAVLSNIGSRILMRPNATQVASFTGTGLGVGLGSADAQTRLHVGMGPGGFAVFGATGVGTGGTTVLTSGVARRAAGHITAWHSGGTGGGASFSIGSGTTTVYNDGTNTVTLQISGGVLTVARGSGSGTFDVTLAFTYQ